MADLLRVEGHTFDPEDLEFGEKREVRRLVRGLWDDEADGPFDWDEVGENEVLPATILVFMRRHDKDYTIEQALACKSRDVYVEDAEATDAPPTKGSKPASARKKTSASAGSPS